MYTRKTLLDSFIINSDLDLFSLTNYLVRMMQTVSRHCLERIIRFINYVIFIFFFAINISCFDDSFLRIQVHDTIIILKKHYLFNWFWSHLWSISLTNSSCKIKCSFNIYKEYWTWKNILSHLSQSWIVQDVVSSILSCWKLLNNSVSAKISIIFTNRYRATLSSLKKSSCSHHNRL